MHPLLDPNIRASAASAEPTEQLARLDYELLDAHSNTSQVLDGPSTDLMWQTHLYFLRDLQRAGREILARGVAEEVRQVRLP